MLGEPDREQRRQRHADEASRHPDENLIGPDVTGTAIFGDALGPVGTGVNLLNGASDNVVEDNLISGNGNGLFILGAGADNNTIQRNLVGTAKGGLDPLGNVASGIRLIGGPV